MIRKFVAVAASALVVLAIAPAIQAATQKVPAQVKAEMSRQLSLMPGGQVVAPNKIHYRSGNITLTFVSHRPGAHLSSRSLSQCQSGWLCLWTDTWFYGAMLETGSEWCALDSHHGMAEMLDLSKYPTWFHNVRSADSENAYFAAGYWDNGWFSNRQWTMHAYGYLGSVSPDNIRYISTCPTSIQNS